MLVSYDQQTVLQRNLYHYIRYVIWRQNPTGYKIKEASIFEAREFLLDRILSIDNHNFSKVWEFYFKPIILRSVVIGYNVW